MKNRGLILLGVIALGIALYICTSRSNARPPLVSSTLLSLDRAEAIRVSKFGANDKVTACEIARVRVDGEELWRRSIAPIGSVVGAAGTNDLILVASSSADFVGSVTAFSRSDGSRRWTTVLAQDEVWLDILFRVDGERVYVEPHNANSHTIHALSLADGQELWTRQIYSYELNVPMLGPGRILFPAKDGGVEVDGATGEVLRQLPFAHACTLSNGAFLAASATHAYVVRFSGEDPAPLFELPTGGSIQRGLCGERNGDWIVGLNIGRGTSEMRRVDPRTGATLWVVPLNDDKPWIGSDGGLPRVVPVVNAFGNNYLALIDLDRGTMTKQDVEGFLTAMHPTLEYALLSDVLFHSGRAYFLGRDGSITELDPETGAVVDVLAFHDVTQKRARGAFAERRGSTVWVTTPSHDWLAFDLPSKRLIHASGSAAMHSLARSGR